MTREQFGQRIREARKAKGETQEELGALLGLKKAQISEIERGNRVTTPERMAIICRHYRISADYLLGLTDDPKPRGWKKETP